MLPAYGLVILNAISIRIVSPREKSNINLAEVLGYVVVAMVIAISWVLPLILPVFALPQPTGNYRVGTQSLWVQTDRKEDITADPSDKRALMLKIWYPSQEKDSNLPTEKYLDAGSRAGFATKYGLPPAALDYLDHVETHAYPEIQIAEGPFPVLIFSHGYGSKASGYYALLSEIASQGYVIINMNHTYESLGATFPNGSIHYFDYQYQESIAAGSMEMVKPMRDAFQQGLDFEARHPIVRKAVQNYFEGNIQKRWSEDITYTLDLLKMWNNRGWLRSKLDLDRIGVFGHSVGGGTAGRVAIEDSRVKAAANLDGIQWGNMIDTAYQIPFLYVSADWPEDHEDINEHIYQHKSTDYFYESRLLQSGHPNFMDIPLMIPFPFLAGTGSIDPQHGLKIVSELLTAFFDLHLKGSPGADPMHVGKKYELLTMEVYKRRSVTQ
jgi:dienelactone hydrolase